MGQPAENPAGKNGRSAEPDAPGATEALIPLVYDELRAIAHGYFRRQPASFTLRPTEIVNEACVQLLRRGASQWDSPQHFRAIAARKMWQVIVDHVKHRHAQKRGGAGIPPPRGQRPAAPTLPAAQKSSHAIAGGPAKLDTGATQTAPGGPANSSARQAAQRVPLDSVGIEWGDRTIDLLDLADALEDLVAESRRLHDVVMLHWFGGLTHAEVAHMLGVSASTAEKDFRYALAWLNRRLMSGETKDAL